MKQTKSKKKKVQLKTKITCHYRTSGNVENTKPLTALIKQSVSAAFAFTDVSIYGPFILHCNS